MALTTRCPNCRTAFKVVADQLRVRNGLVRCGSCGTVFDGRACLEGAEAAPAPAPVAVPVVPPAPATPAAAAPPADPTPLPSYLAKSQAGSPLNRAPELSAAPSSPAGPAIPASPAISTSPASPVISPGPASPAISASPPFFSADPPAVLRGRNRDVQPSAQVPERIPDEMRVHADGRASDAIHAGDRLGGGQGFIRVAVPAGLTVVHDVPDIHTVPQDDAVHVPIRAYDPDESPADQDEPEFTVGGIRQDAVDQDVPGEGVYGDVRTRYSSATDVGRAPPQFLDQDLIKSHHIRRRAWTWLCLLGCLALCGQLLYVYRTPITISMPGLRPAFVGVCKALGCKVSYARRIERIWIESSSLRMTPPNNAQQAGNASGAVASGAAGSGAAPAADGTSRMVLGAVLRNRYEKDQEWPALDLKLRDKSDTVVAEKVILPRDYLPPGTTGPMAAGAEVTISVPIVVKGLQINGFGLKVFFP